LDVTLHSACDTDVRGWNTHAGIRSGSNPSPPATATAMAASSSIFAIARTSGAFFIPANAAEPDRNGFVASTVVRGSSSDHVTQSSGLASLLCTGAADSSSSGRAGAGTNVLSRTAVSRWSELRADDEDDEEDEEEEDSLPCSTAAASCFGSSGSGAGFSPPNGVITLALPGDGVSGEAGEVGVSATGEAALQLQLPDDDGVPGDAGEPGWGSMTSPGSQHG
jgi:hypothetical protein